MAEIIIEKLKKNDAPLLAATFQKAILGDFKHYPKNAVDKFIEIWSEKYFNKRKKVVVIAKNDSKIVGFVIGRKQWLDSGVGEIEWVWVNKNHRNKGVARKMLENAEKIYRDSGHHKVELTADSPKTWEIYKRFGFKKEGFNRDGMWHIDTYKYGKIL